MPYWARFGHIQLPAVGCCYELPSCCMEQYFFAVAKTEVMAGAGVMVRAKGMGRRGCSRAAQAKETAGAARAMVRASLREVEREVAGYIERLGVRAARAEVGRGVS